MKRKNKTEKNTCNRWQIPLVLSGLLMVAFLFALWFPRMLPKTEATPVVAQTDTKLPVGRHPLTGISIYEQMSLPHVYGVMIDNHIDAWPQAGLDKAFLVFEAPVEAGISRFLAFFSQEQTVDKIGPVRSARPYFLDWNNEMDGLYAHVGGSDAALDQIESGGTLDLNQYWFDTAYWRAKSRYAPHNVYTSTNLLGSYVKKKDEQGTLADPLYESWLFKDSVASVAPDVEMFTISFYPPTYIAKWSYNQQTNQYGRFQKDLAHVVEDGAQIVVDNVAVIVADIKILDAVGRREIKTIGEGKAIVFQDGLKKEGIWKKSSESQRIRFYAQDDQEIVFNAGITWVEVVGKEEQVVEEKL